MENIFCLLFRYINHHDKSNLSIIIFAGFFSVPKIDWCYYLFILRILFDIWCHDCVSDVTSISRQLTLVCFHLAKQALMNNAKTRHIGWWHACLFRVNLKMAEFDEVKCNKESFLRQSYFWLVTLLARLLNLYADISPLQYWMHRHKTFSQMRKEAFYKCFDGFGLGHSSQREFPQQSLESAIGGSSSEWILNKSKFFAFLADLFQEMSEHSVWKQEPNDKQSSHLIAKEFSKGWKAFLQNQNPKSWYFNQQMVDLFSS